MNDPSIFPIRFVGKSVCGSCVLFLAALSCLSSQVALADGRPNIVMAFADDWGKYASAYAKLEDGSIHDHEGKLFAVNSQIDPTTGTLTLEATFPNPTKLVRPGQYAKIRFVRDTRKDALLVWQRAVQELQSIHQVYVVKEDGTVDVRQVKVGEKVDGLWVIEEGLSPNDHVVVEGVQRIRPGMAVTAASPEDLKVIPPDSALLAKQKASEKKASEPA